MGLFDRLFGRKKQEPPIEEVVKEALENIGEIEEETGILTTPHQIYCLFQKEYSNVIHVLYKVKLKASAQTVPIKLSWEHRDYKWITRQKLCQITPPDADRYYLDVIEYLCASTPELP